MRVNYGAIFQDKSKDSRMGGLVNIPLDRSLWPPEWKTTYYKDYDRFTSIKLPIPMPLSTDQSIYEKRCSDREMSGKTVSIGVLSNILYYAAGEKMSYTDSSLLIGESAGESVRRKRNYPSAGGRHPLEIYILNYMKGDLDIGVYHYNVKTHSLEYMWPFPDGDSGNAMPPYIRYSKVPWAKDAAMSIVITAVVRRNTMKYGERGYKYMYIEAGGVLHSMQIHSELNGLASVINGGTDEYAIEKLLDIDGSKETVILGMLLGSKLDVYNLNNN